MARRTGTWVSALSVVALGAAALVAAPPATAAEGDPEAVKIIQIGDSYSAGNGAGAYYGPADCYRSHDSWAAEYTEWLADNGDHVTYLSRACSGAVTANLTDDRRMDSTTGYLAGIPEATPADEVLAEAESRQACRTRYPDEEYHVYSNPRWDPRGFFMVSCERWLRPQIDAVGADTDVVMLTLGGNDLGFADIITQCFAVGPRDPGGCRTEIENARAGIGALEDDLAELLGDLRTRMGPDGQVVLLSYPYLSNRDSWVLRSFKDKLPWVSGDRIDAGAEVRALGDEGDTAQRAAVAAANTAAGAPFVTFVDTVKDHFAGHEPDPSATNRNPDRWIHEFDTLTMAEWYHPTKEGHFEESTLLRVLPTAGREPTAGSGSLDLVFVIDTTGSMGGAIDAVKEWTSDMVDHLAATTSSYRFALVTYRDHPGHTGDPIDYAARVDLPFTTDTETIRAALASMVPEGGGDTPEAALSGLDAAISLPYRPGVKKVAIIIGDAPAHDPEPISGLTGADIIERALAVDPVEVYPVSLSSWDNLELDGVAAGTGGFPTTASGDLATDLADTITAAMDKPYAWLAGPYVTAIGTELVLDARGSYAPAGSLVSYEWDLDGDGTYDRTTTEPVITHTWAEPVDDFLAVRVTDGAGRSSIATTVLVVSPDGDEVDQEVDNCPAVANPGQEDSDLDGIGDACDPQPFPTFPQGDVIVFEEDAPGVVASSSLAGHVLADSDGDGAADAPVAGVEVRVSGADAGGEPVSVSVTSGADGAWTAAGLLPGAYAVTADGAEAGAVGTLSGAADGSSAGEAADDGFDGIVLAGVGASASGYVLAIAPDDVAPTPDPSPTTPSPSPTEPDASGTDRPGTGTGDDDGAGRGGSPLPATGAPLGVALALTGVLLAAGVTVLLGDRRRRLR